METGYSGLRRTRKRAHSSKCPCCYSSEEEQENYASAKKEKVKDHGNQNNGKPSRTRKRKVASDDNIDNKDASKECVSPAESVDESQNSKKPKTTLLQKPKTNRKQRKTASLKQESTDNVLNSDGFEQNNKQSSKGDKTAKKKKSKTGLSTSNDKDENAEGDNVAKSEDTSEKMPSPQIQAKSRKSKKKNTKQEFKNGAEDIDKNEIELKDKCLNIKKGRARNVASSGNIGAQKQGSKDIGEQGKLFSDIKTSGAKTNDKQSKARSKNGKSKDVPNGSTCELSKEREDISLGNNKHTKTLNSNSNDLAKRKIEVFDHLFGQLKKCPGFSKTTVSSAAKLLLQLDADGVKSLVSGSPSKKSKTGVALNRQASDNLPSSSAKSKTAVSLSEPKRRCTESEKSLLQSSGIKSVACVPSSKKTTSGQAEEVKLSQAAEALVSFRANPTILRQEKTEADIPLVRSTNQDIATNNVEKKLEMSLSSASTPTHTPEKVIETLVQAVTTTNEVRLPQDSESCYVNAPSQRHVTSQLPSSLLMQGALHQPVCFPASLGANLKQVATVQQNLILSQFSSQLNSAPAVPVPFSPRVNDPSSENPRMMNPTSVQNIQALYRQATQPSNIQTPMPAQTHNPTLAASGINQQLQPQQPLKGMEEVVSCVGSRSTTNLLWNIKPTTSPVVYLTSPQTLSGVRARNFISQNEGHKPLPYTASVAKVHSVGLPKASLISASTSALTYGSVTLVNQAASLSTSHAANMTGQRKILPRDQRMPSVFASTPQRASQLPVTSVVGHIPRNIQPVRVGSMPVQFGGLGVTSPLNTRQPSISAVVTQASAIQTPVIQVPVVHAASVTTGQTTAVSSAVLTPVSAKQAVKKFVHERTKSAELKRTGSLSNLLPVEPVTSSAAGEQQEIIMISAPSSQSGQLPPSSQGGQLPLSSQGGQLLDQPEKQSASNNQPEFNLHQAASALLSISSQDGLDATEGIQPVGAEGDDSLDEQDDEVVFTSKGVFRVGDVDVDPQYNRIGREGYTCGKCGKIFTSLSYLARHIKRVCPDMSCRKWKCTMCDKAFRHPFGLQQHIYTHTGERPHKCSQCPKAFYSSNDLRRHSRIHSGERPYHCKHCDKSFATTISLKTHTYIHTGEKPHKCPHCPKTFATSSKLGRHIVTHSEQRPYACEHCPKSFNRSGDLRRHNMHVHESREKPINFDDCGTPLNTTDNVSIPRDTPKEQDSGQMHQCSVCGEVCDSLNDFRHHMICHAAPMSLVSNQIGADKEVDHLNENIESGSIDSN